MTTSTTVNPTGNVRAVTEWEETQPAMTEHEKITASLANGALAWGFEERHVGHGLAGAHGYPQRRARKGIGGHQSAHMDKDEWLTPPPILAALGPFDLDPCAPVDPPWSTARTHLTIQDNGLLKSWSGRVWLNPPYGPETGKWLGKLAEHGNGIALIFARTETADWVTHVWRAADAILFIFGRLYFHHVNGNKARANSGAPSALIAYGQNNVTALRESGISGALITDWSGSSCASADNGGSEARHE